MDDYNMHSKSPSYNSQDSLTQIFTTISGSGGGGAFWGPYQQTTSNQYTYTSNPFLIQLLGLQQQAQTVHRPSVPERVLPKSLVAGPIIAHRVWGILGEDTLCSYSQSIAWVKGVPLSSICSSFRHPKPASGCGCGLWGIKTVEKLREHVGGGGAIHGRVALWGPTIEHVDGYRAKYGYPILLYPPAFNAGIKGFPIPPATVRILQKLGDAYGCHICTNWNDWEALNDQRSESGSK